MDRRSICRIVVKEGSRISVGTGFLVTPDRVLTAAHVVCSANDSNKPHAGNDIELRFTGDAGPVIVKNARVERFRADDDWALLSCPGAPAVAPMPLRTLSGQHRFSWQTFGFPEGFQNNGLAYQGKTLTPDRNTQLLSDQKLGAPAGFSGAPLVVGRYVAGIILASRDAQQSETLFALDLGVVASNCPEVNDRIEKHDPPYLADVTARIEECSRALLPNAALAVAIEPKGVADGELPRELARSMMRGGVTSTLKALDQLVKALAREHSEEILELAAETWIDHYAVRLLWELVSDPDYQEVILLNAADPRIGKSYARRAGCIDSNLPGKCLSSPLHAARGQPGVMVAEFEKALAAALMCDPEELDEEYDAHDHRDKPIIVWIPPPIPSKAEIDEIRTEKGGRYRRVKLLLFVGPEVPPAVKDSFPSARLIEPRLEPNQDVNALELHVKAQKALARQYKRA